MMTNHSNPTDDDSEKTKAFEPSTADDATLLPPADSAPHDEYATLDQSQSGKAIEAPSRPKSIKYFGDYEILSEIARGGMGVVYKARQSKLNRIVAVKMILSGELASQEAISRFFTEAQSAATLDHPGIVPVYEIGEHEGKHYFTMGYIEGKSLAEKVTQGPLPPKEAAEMTRKIAEAIAYAHSKGVIHRDLKPANVLLDANGEPKVSDFGRARKIEQDSGLTRTGAVMGTPSYMPPEQAAGKTSQVGPLSDVYSLGAILYCLLTGRPPFQAANPLDTMMQVIEKEPVSVQTLNSGVPKDLETICHKCLQKDPAKRYGSAQEFADDLQRWLKGEPIRARAVSRSERAWRWIKRNPVLSGSIASAISAVILGSIASLWFGIESKRSEVRALASAEESRRNLYSGHMNLAHRNWESNRVELARDLLSRQLPEVRNLVVDMRGFEWYYMDRLINLPWASFKGGAVFSPDGTRLAAGYGALKLWDVSTGQEILKQGWAEQDCVAFSPEGKYIAYSCFKNEVSILDLSTGQETVKLQGHSDPVYSIAFSPDGKRLATGSMDKTIKLWNAASGLETATLQGHSDSVDCVAFSPDGERIASASVGDQTVKLWDVSSGEETATINVQSFHSKFVFSPDGEFLATTGRTLKLWDVQTGVESMALKGISDEVTCVAFSPDGKRLAFGGNDSPTKIYNWTPGEEEVTTLIRSGPVRSLAFSPDGTRLLCDESLWDCSIDQDKVVLKGHFDDVVCVAFSPDGKQLASVSNDQTIKLWDLSTGQEKATLQRASATDGQVFKYWNLATGQESISIQGHSGHIYRVAFSPDGKGLRSSFGSTTAFSPDETRLAFVKFGKRIINLMDVSTGKQTATFEGQTDNVNSVVFSPNGLQLASGSEDGIIKLWSISSGREMATLKHSSRILSLDFRPDGKQLASGSMDCSIKIWNLATGENTVTLQGHTDTIFSMAFTPDCKRLASASRESIIKLWDLTTGQETMTVKGSNFVAFSPDGWRLATTSGSDILIYDARPWTPETRLEQQALCLARGMLPKSDTEASYLSAIRENKTFTEEARNRALEYAPLFWRSKQRKNDPTADQLKPQ